MNYSIYQIYLFQTYGPKTNARLILALGRQVARAHAEATVISVSKNKKKNWNAYT